MIRQKGLCIIPARGGSKRFPKKNLAKLKGKSLVKICIESAIESELFSDIILSSDDNKILSEGDQYGDKVKSIKRDSNLATDSSTALELVCDLCERFSSGFDFVALLLPTAPLRKSSHLRDGFSKLYSKNDIDGVVSLTQYDFPPQLSVYLKNDLIKPIFEPCPLIEGNTRSQDQEIIYRPNGAFYMQKFPAFNRNKNFWKGNVTGYIMERNESADIDNPLDLKIAELLIEDSLR